MSVLPQTQSNEAIVQTAGVTNWSVNHAPTSATQATITKTAGGTGVRHVCNSITASIACNSTAQTPLNVYLRDGASGSGTILWACSLSATANGTGGLIITGINIVGSANTAMTLEFSAAGVTGSVEAVSLTGYDTV